MKQQILAGLIITLFSTASYASIKDKKAMRAVDENIATEAAKVKTSCGNPALDVKVNWDEFKTMITKNTEKLANDRYKSQWVISHAGQRTVSVLEAVAGICKDDADYKEELAKLSKILVTPKADFTDSASEFTLDSNVLSVKSGHKMNRSASDFMKKIKALY
tara:strand:- start:276 stop:761 length:486 start_codon:yes stop_codon:yes gene_type:complete